VSLIDFILNLAALLLWLSWRSQHFDPLAHTTPATLVGTLRRAEPRRWHGWQWFIAALLVVAVRAWIYWTIGSPADWTPKLDLGVVALAFPSNHFLTVLVFSILSFGRALVIFYFWLLILALINRGTPEPDAIQKLIRLHLGCSGRWPWPLQFFGPLLLTATLWAASYPLLVRVGVLDPVRANLHVLEQGLLIGSALVFSLKYLLPPFFLLYLLISYVYLGSSPVWDFIGTTARNLLRPLGWLPLRLARLDLRPIAGLALVLLLLHWLPAFVLDTLTQRHLALWPQ
jgi:hypothetical protein